MKHIKLFCLVLICLPTLALAKSRAHHDHTDLFGESDLTIGFRLGTQLSGFTSIQKQDTVISVQSSMRPVLGAAFKFIYGLPRVEFDLLWNMRGWVNTGDTVHSLAVPLLLKFPIELMTDFDLELGAGYQGDVVLFGADPHKTFMSGLVGSIGFSMDYTPEYLIEFEARYVVGLENVSSEFNGARPRDFQILGGLSYHF